MFFFLPTDEQKRKESHQKTITMAVTFGIIILVLIIIGFVIVIRLRNRQTVEARVLQESVSLDYIKDEKDEPGGKEPGPERYSNIPNLSTACRFSKLPGELESVKKFSNKELIYIEELGEGAFGKVRK